MILSPKGQQETTWPFRNVTLMCFPRNIKSKYGNLLVKHLLGSQLKESYDMIKLLDGMKIRKNNENGKAVSH